MRSSRRFARVLAILVLFAAAAPTPARDRDGITDEEYESVHHSAGTLRRQLRVDVPGADRVAEHFARPEVQQALGLEGGNEKIAFDQIANDPAKFKAAAAAAAELYRFAGFEAVHEALKRKGISADGTKRIAFLRNEMLARAADRVSQKYGRIGVNNFSVAKSVKSDIDFTLFADWHQPEFVQPLGPDGKPPDGTLLKTEFYQAYRELWGVKAETMEICAHAAEARIPDWIHAKDSQKFALEYRKGVQPLVENVEAYFLEGAYRMQIDRRTFSGKDPLFVVHNGNLAGDGAVREHFHAREAMYRSIPPDFRKGYAFGAAVGNWHFFQAHAGDPGHFTKYVLRSVEDGMRLLHLEPGDDVKGWPDWKGMSTAERNAFLLKAFGPDTGSLLPAAKVRKIMGIAVAVRAAADNYGQKKWEIFRKDAQEIWETKHKGRGEPPESWRESLVAEAEAHYEAECRQLMIDNCVRTAKARAADFTNARTVIENMRKRGHLPESISDDTLRKNLRTATLYETYLAMKNLDPEVRQRIVASVDGPARRFLENVNELAEARRQIFETPSHWKRTDPGFFDKVEQRWDAEVAKLKAAAFDIDVRIRHTNIEPRLIGSRIRTWSVDAIGKSYQRPMWAVEQVGRKLRKNFDGKKLARRCANLGNLDSILVIIRAGQESGWDWRAVGQATLFEAIGNLPYAGPLMAAKGALVDGEFLGAGVMVGAYFWPVVGQVYLVGDISWNTFKILEHTTHEGIVDMILDGVSPDEASGPLNTARRMWGVALEGVIYEEYGPSKFMSPLRPVPGETAAEKRKNWFAYVDGMLGPKLAANGYDPLKWDDAKLRVIEAFVGRYLKQFEETAGPFEGDAMLQRYWAQPISRLMKSWLDRPDTRQRLIARLSEMYVEGLHARALAEGQSIWEKMKEGCFRAVAKMMAFEDSMAAAAAEWARAAGEIYGVVDYSEEPPAPPEWPEVEPRAKVMLRVPADAKLELNRMVVVEAEVEEVEGKFVKPFHYRWSFGRQPEPDPRVGEDLEFVKVKCGASPVTSAEVRLEVRDSSGTDWESSAVVGSASVTVTGSGVTSGSGAHRGEGRFWLVRARVGIPQVSREWHTVRLATPRRPIDKLVAEYRAKLAERYPRAEILEVEAVGGPFDTPPTVPPRREIRGEER